MIERGARIFLDQLKERLPLRSTGIIKDLFAKFFEFFKADWLDRFGDRFASFPRDSVDVDEFFEWHRTRLFGWIAVNQDSIGLYPRDGIGKEEGNREALNDLLFSAV